MTYQPSRRSVLGGIGSTALLSLLYGSQTVAAETSHNSLSATRSATADSFVTTTEPEPIAQSDAPIVADERTATTSDVSVSETTETAITAGVPESGAVPSGDTIDIWAGVVDTSGPPTGVEGESLTIEITRPDGETDEFGVVTDENGSASIAYSIQADLPGNYEATVAGTEAFTATVDFDVGPVLEATTNVFRSRPALTGDQTIFGFLLQDGQSPIPNESVTITFFEDDTEIDQTTVETDDTGFATVTDSPETPGSRRVEATATVDGVDLFDSIEYPVSDIGYEYDFFSLDPVLAGRNVSQGGRIWGGDGPLTNTTIELTYANDEANIEITETATTDDNGFFAVAFEAPTDIDSLDVAVETTDGRSAALGDFEDSISVSEPPVDEDTGADPEIDASIDLSRVSPSTTVPLEITATTADGDPIVGESVSVLVRYEFGNGAPLYSTTVDTDTDGAATAEIDIPANAPDGARIDATAVLETDELQLEDSDGVTIEATNIFSTVNFGEELSFDLDVTERATEDPVAGVYGYTDLQYISGRAGSIATVGLVSDANGTDSATAASPDDLSFMIAENKLSVYDSSTAFLIPRGPYSGNLSATLDGAADPGTEISLEYDVAAETVSGLLYGSVGDVPVATTFDTVSDSPSITVPEGIFADSLTLNVWAIGSDGNPYAGFTTVTVNPDGEVEPTAEFTISAFEPESVTRDAGELFSTSATITNVGEATETQTVEVSVAGTVVETEEIELGVDAEEEVAYDLSTENLTSGEYMFTIATDDDTASGNLTVSAPEEHPSGVSQTLADTIAEEQGISDVDNPDEWDLGDLREVISDWNGEQLYGVDASLADLRALVVWALN